MYFGWLGTLIGLIAIAGNRFEVWGDMDKMGSALAVAMLTIFYGYLLKLITMALINDGKSYYFFWVIFMSLFLF